MGLTDFGRPEGFLEGQIRRWKKQFDASYWPRPVRGAGGAPDRLAVSPPVPSAAGIVHGDYRLDNVLTDDRDQLAAVIDWEMATLATCSPTSALLVLYGWLGALAGGDVLADASSAPGFFTEDELLARYADRSSPRISSTSAPTWDSRPSRSR